MVLKQRASVAKGKLERSWCLGLRSSFFLISFCWIGGFLGVLVGTMINPAASTHYIGSIVGVFAAFTLAVGLFVFR
jgi:hypothetical protein